jgi:hypothetical protein
MGGILISKATVTPQVQAEDILRGLVASLGQAAEKQGLVREEDLDAAVEDAQRRAFRERYEK